MDEIIDTTVRPEVKPQGPKYSMLYTKHIWGAWHVIHRDAKLVYPMRCGSKQEAKRVLRNLTWWSSTSSMQNSVAEAMFRDDGAKKLPEDFDA